MMVGSLKYEDNDFAPSLQALKLPARVSAC